MTNDSKRLHAALTYRGVPTTLHSDGSLTLERGDVLLIDVAHADELTPAVNAALSKLARQDQPVAIVSTAGPLQGRCALLAWPPRAVSDIDAALGRYWLAAEGTIAAVPAHLPASFGPARLKLRRRGVYEVVPSASALVVGAV